MTFIDISWPVIPGMTEYKDKGSVDFVRNKDFPEHGVRDSDIQMNVHTGTHVDAPSHFLEDGCPIDSLSPGALVGKCKVLEFAGDMITGKDLERKDISEDDIILLKTKNSRLDPRAPFEPRFVFLEKTGASFLADRRIRAVGIDYLGIERSQPAHETHKALMGAGITIIEGLRLEDAKEREYTLLCLPLMLVGMEAAPARAVLKE